MSTFLICRKFILTPLMVSQTNTEVELFQLLQCHGTGQVELELPEGSISKSQQKVVMLISGSCQLISMEEKITSTYKFSFYIKQDRFTTCFKTCGTGSLLWRVGRVCKVPLVPRLWKQNWQRERLTKILRKNYTNQLLW